MAARQGKSLARNAQTMSERMAPGVYTSLAPTDAVQGGAQATMFQRQFNARSRYDDEMNTKMQLMDEKGMTPFGQVYYDDKVGRWLQDKEAAAETANFDAYFGSNFVKNDLASRQWAQEINPEYFESREREMDAKAELVLKIKKIQLRGPQNEEELAILYLIEEGRVELTEGWDQIGVGFSGKPSSEQQKKNEDNFRQGLIRMPMFLTNKQHQERAKTNKAVGAWGDERTKNAFYGGEPPTVKLTQNQPLSTRAGGDTIGMNWRNFLGGK